MLALWNTRFPVRAWTGKHCQPNIGGANWADQTPQGRGINELSLVYFFMIFFIN